VLGEYRITLGQVKVADKSNEITAIPALLELLDVAGCIITIDAMGTQTAIAAQIQQANADYILALKANHPTLYQQVKDWFEQAEAQDFAGMGVSLTNGSKPDITVLKNVPVGASQCPNCRLYINKPIGLDSCVVMVVRVRHLWNKTTREVHLSH